jgi:hypothetical protein
MFASGDERTVSRRAQLPLRKKLTQFSALLNGGDNATGHRTFDLMPLCSAYEDHGDFT